MPVTFDSIKTEHTAVREAAGRFDVSHMGNVVVSGPDACELMNRLTTNDVDELDAGEAQYSCILRDDGVILDDTVVYNHPFRDGYLFIPNAGNDEDMVVWWSEHARKWDLTASIENKTAETGMVAIQGPEAVEEIERATRGSVADISRFSATKSTINGVECLLARTGYTGEDGFEILFPADESKSVWTAFDGLQPCGLGARDTLRLETGLLLSGQDFHPTDDPRTPYEANLGFVVDLSKSDFVGKQALKRQYEDDVEQRLVGLEVTERAIARHGYPIRSGGAKIGRVTSGTMSPTFGIPLALGYVDVEYAETGAQVEIDVRDRSVTATVVNQRFLEHRDREISTDT